MIQLVLLSIFLAHGQQTTVSAEQCVYDSDCVNDLICKWGRCVSICKNNKDCKEGEYCAQKYKYGEAVPALFSATVCVKRGDANYQAPSFTTIEAFQAGITFWGGNYREFPLKDENPSMCYQSCKDDPRCSSWSYARPTVVSDAPYCIHKDKIGQTIVNAGMISGVIDRK